MMKERFFFGSFLVVVIGEIIRYNITNRETVPSASRGGEEKEEGVFSYETCIAWCLHCSYSCQAALRR